MHAHPYADERRDEAENRGANKQCLAGAARARGWRWLGPWLGDDARHRLGEFAAVNVKIDTCYDVLLWWRVFPQTAVARSGSKLRFTAVRDAVGRRSL